MALAAEQTAFLQQAADGVPNWHVVAAFCDINPGAARPGRTGAVGAAQSGGFDLLLVASLDRLTRSTDELHDLIGQFTTADVVVCTLGRRSTRAPQQTGNGPDQLTVTGDRAGSAAQQMRALGAAHQPLPELTSRPAPADGER
jgi:hypothetical protein